MIGAVGMEIRRGSIIRWKEIVAAILHIRSRSHLKHTRRLDYFPLVGTYLHDRNQDEKDRGSAEEGPPSYWAARIIIGVFSHHRAHTHTVVFL